MTSSEPRPVSRRSRGNVAATLASPARPDLLRHPPADSGMCTLLKGVWSSSEFDGDALDRFAQQDIRQEAQQGIFILGSLTMILMAGLALLYFTLHLGTPYVYTFSLLAALSGHIAVSAKVLSNVKVLHLLGMVLLSVCGLAFMLLAHRYGGFTSTLFSTVVVLFMVVPLVPWGLREALLATGIVYLIFTASTLSAVSAFSSETLWTLQFLMLTSAMIALTVVIRAVLIRKAHVAARFRLTVVNSELYGLSHRDALTGAWNRRFLEEQFSDIVARYSADSQAACFCLTDIDNFKKLNDTHGHPCGDHVLQLLVSELNEALVSDEYVVRMGGDEFAILLRGDLAQERIGQALHRFNRHNEACPELTTLPRVSAGLVHLPSGIPVVFEACYLQADMALYAAKARSSGEALGLDAQGQGAQ